MIRKAIFAVAVLTLIVAGLKTTPEASCEMNECADEGWNRCGVEEMGRSFDEGGVFCTGSPGSCSFRM